MDLIRRRGDWAFSVLLVWAHALSVLAGFNDSNAIVQSLDCTNDLSDWISCDMKAPNCALYELLFLEKNKTMHCKQCTEDKCCCHTNPPETILPVYGESHTVIVWKGGQNLGSKQIDVIAGITPRVPKIESVRNSNGIFEILWRSNMEGFVDSNLSADVIYFKKGETNKTSIPVTPTSRGNLKVYQLPSQNLEPSTTYVVCVRSYSGWSGRYSDCSAEAEFTTPMSRGTVALIVIVSLSVAAVLVSSGAFVCFVKIKTLWWDTVPKPKLLLMNLSEQKILKPALPVLSLVHVQPLMTGDGKPWFLESVITAEDPPSAFTRISPVSRLSDSNFGFGCGFDNKSYSIVLPGFPQQEETSEVQTQGELICSPAYRDADGDGEQLLEHLLLTSALLPLVDTEMCYQVTRMDSVQVPHGGDSRRPSISGRSSPSCESSSGLGLKFDSADGDAAKMDDSGEPVQELFSGGSSLPVDFSYQTFQSLVDPSDALMLEKLGGEEQLNGYADGASTVPCGTDGDGSASPTFQRPFFSLLSAKHSTPTIIVDSGYQSVVTTDA